MPTYEEIKKQTKNLDGVSQLGRKEIRELSNILWEDEKIERIVRGCYGKGWGILVATNKRLIFVDKGLLYVRVEDFPHDKITSIQYELGLLLGKITIFASGNRADITHVDKKQARTFCEYVRARISPVKEHASFSISQVQKTEFKEDLVDKLKELAKLKEQGILSEEEFQNAKKKILGQ